MSGVAAPPIQDAAPRHSWIFRRRRFANWFPLGLTYATFYMGRYNFNVAKKLIGDAHHFDKAQMGLVATAGFWTYALSVLFNGPLADRFGGRRAILLGAVGAAVFNLAFGLLFLSGWTAHLLVSMCVLYALNSYFQSFGALSVVKVNSAWFHVRERGLLGGFFSTMISLGYAFAFTIGSIILANLPLGYVFVIPAVALMGMFLVDLLLVKNRPSDAGYDDFATGDEHHGDDPSAQLTFRETVRRIFSHRVIRILAVAEFCTGIVRQGVMLYYPEFLAEVHATPVGSPLSASVGTGITIAGILGGFACGAMSDYLFQSRRAPVAFVFYLGQIGALYLLGRAGSPAFAAFMIAGSAMWIFGVHGMLSGTASMDFGGKKAAATAAGLLDGVQYLGSSLVGVGLGWILDRYHWKVWPYVLMPFSFVGALLMLTLWNARPKGGAAH